MRLRFVLVGWLVWCSGCARSRDVAPPVPPTVRPAEAPRPATPPAADPARDHTSDEARGSASGQTHDHASHEKAERELVALLNDPALTEEDKRRIVLALLTQQRTDA